MENRKDLSLLEMVLMAINNCLSHKALFSIIVAIPTIVVFVSVMWVLKPIYKSEAIFTPPVENNSINTSNLSSFFSDMPGGSMLSQLLGNSSDGVNVVWTFINSWELHDKIINKFNLAEDYEFDGNFHADLLRAFRSDLSVEINDEDMFVVGFEHEDYKKATAIVEYLLVQADSMYNAYKTNQARQAREYIDERIAEVNRSRDSLQNEFVDFQHKNNFYEPEIQLESTLKYMSSLQTERESINLELAYERSRQSEKTKRIEELEQRLRSIDKSINQVIKGKQSNVGLVALDKTPKLSAQYAKLKNDLKIQQSIYLLLREQREQMDIDANNQQANLVVLQPAWENNKRIFPKRGSMLVFTFMICSIFAVLLCSLVEHFNHLDNDSLLFQEKNRFLFLLKFKK